MPFKLSYCCQMSQFLMCVVKWCCSVLWIYILYISVQLSRLFAANNASFVDQREQNFARSPDDLNFKSTTVLNTYCWGNEKRARLVLPTLFTPPLWKCPISKTCGRWINFLQHSETTRALLTMHFDIIFQTEQLKQNKNVNFNVAFCR